MSGDRVAAARQQAAALKAQPRSFPPPSASRLRRTLAMGDPQASLQRVLEVLDAHGALGEDGRLAEDVALISMGDHFDWGPPSQRTQAAEDGEHLLRWLAAHAPEQVILLAGNHDLARVGELWGLEDAAFAASLAAADLVWSPDRKPTAEEERAFKSAHPRWFSCEMVARDLSTFRASQRDLVAELLRSGRLQAAHAAQGSLLVHAGVTRHELDLLGLAESAAAEVIAAALNERLAQAAAHLEHEPLRLPGLHEPGDGRREGAGMFYHRPSLGEGEHAQRFLDPRPWRRFRPDDLPRGLVQVVGHVGDKKCRQELQRWSDGGAFRYGVLRHLIVEGDRGRYSHGPPTVVPPHAAVMIFTDGGMKDVAQAGDYELLDVAHRTSTRRP